MIKPRMQINKYIQIAARSIFSEPIFSLIRPKRIAQGNATSCVTRSVMIRPVLSSPNVAPIMGNYEWHGMCFDSFGISRFVREAGLKLVF